MITRLSPIDIKKLPDRKESSAETERKSSCIVLTARKAISQERPATSLQRLKESEKAIELVSTRAMRLIAARHLSPLRHELYSARLSPLFHLRQPTTREEPILRKAHLEMVQGKFIIKAPIDLHLWVRAEIGRQGSYLGFINGPISVIGNFDRIRKKVFAIERYQKLSFHEVDIIQAFRAFLKAGTIDPKNKIDIYLWMIRRAVLVGLTEGEFTRTLSRLWLTSDSFCERRIQERIQEEFDKGNYRIDEDLRLRAFALRGLRFYDCHRLTVEHFFRSNKHLPVERPRLPLRARAMAMASPEESKPVAFVMKFAPFSASSSWVQGDDAIKQEAFITKLNLKLASLQSR